MSINERIKNRLRWNKKASGYTGVRKGWSDSEQTADSAATDVDVQEKPQGTPNEKTVEMEDVGVPLVEEFVDNIEEAVTAELNSEAANADDHNRTMSPDEIAAMFAKAQGNSTEAVDEKHDVEEVKEADIEKSGVDGLDVVTLDLDNFDLDNLNLELDFSGVEEPPEEHPMMRRADNLDVSKETSDSEQKEEISSEADTEGEKESESESESGNEFSGEELTEETEELPAKKGKNKEKANKEKKKKADKRKEKKAKGAGGLKALSGMLGRKKKVKLEQSAEVAALFSNLTEGMEPGDDGSIEVKGEKSFLDEMLESTPENSGAEVPDILEDVTEVYIKKGENEEVYVDLEEAEDLARKQLMAESEAEKATELDGEVKLKPEEIYIDPSTIKVPKKIAADEEKKAAYIKKAIAKEKAKLRKKETAEANKIKKAEAKAKKKEADKKAKAEWKKAAPERKKQKAAENKKKKADKRKKKAELKAVKREKKAVKREKRRAKRAEKKAIWKAKPATDKTIIRMVQIILILSVVIVGFTFGGDVFGKIKNLPAVIAEKRAARELEKEEEKVDGADSSLLESIDGTVEKQNASTDVFKDLGIASSLAANSAKARYVSPEGNDNGTGLMEDPFRTIQHGIDEMVEGGILYVEAGTYNERININRSGQPRSYLTICSKDKDDKAIIDGEGLSEKNSLVNIVGCEYVTFANMELMNAAEAIHVENAKAVIIAGNSIHDIKNTDGEAYGISVENKKDTVMRSIMIYYNSIGNIGNGAAVHVSGNYEYVNLFGNHIKSVLGNGIEYIGGNSVCNVSAYDGPRNSTIEGNSIKLCKGQENPGHAVYLDATRGVKVEENIAYRCGIGIKVTSSVGKEGYYSDETMVRNNLVACNGIGGIYVGTDPSSEGYVDQVKIVNNSCINSYGKGGYDLYLCNVGELIARKNIFANNKAGGTPVYIDKSFVGTPIFKIDGNVYLSLAESKKAKFVYKGEEIKGFASWKKNSGEVSGIYYNGNFDELCRNSAAGDYTYDKEGTTVGAKVIKAGK